jgi:dethiobiotin synthetase
VVLVCGTGTDVGKTWTACALAARWRREGRVVRARKPAQSFTPETEDRDTDASLLARATGDAPGEVCPPHRWYGVPMAPPMAADALGEAAPTMAELLDELDWPDDVAIGLLETVGGVRSPLAADGDAVALGLATAPDVSLLVATAGLGVINNVLLAVDALTLLGAPVVVFLNRHHSDDELHERNARWLIDVEGLTVETDIDHLAARLLAPSPQRP